MLLICSASVVRAQDVIVKKDGSTVICRVVELNATEIVYKKWSDLNGSSYIMDRSLASAINYENGKRETLGEVQNQYQPHNQNDGVQQMNDQALLRMDQTANSPRKKVNTLKTIGWIGGAALVAFSLWPISGGDSGSLGGVSGGLAFTAGGIAWTTGFLLAANRQKKKMEMLNTSSLYHQEFNFSNGTSLSAGIDVLSDHSFENNMLGRSSTLGLGLRYNF